MSSKQLPQPTEFGTKLSRNAKTLIKLVASIPFVGTALEAFFSSQMEAATEALMEAIEKGEIELLTEERYNYLIPLTYKYYESARTGATVRKLKILANILIENVTDFNKIDSNFSRICKKLEYLEDSDLEFVAKIYEIEKKNGLQQDLVRVGLFYINADILANKNDNGQVDTNEWLKISEILNNIASSGLLIPDGMTRYDKVSENYYITEDLRAICIASQKNSK